MQGLEALQYVYTRLHYTRSGRAPEMIVSLEITNRLQEQILLRSNMGSGQPIAPQGGSLAMTFELQPGDDGVAHLVLVIEPQQTE